MAKWKYKLVVAAVVLFIFLPVAGLLVLNRSFFTVNPDSGAVVLDRKGNPLREVGPGLHLHNPVMERVVIMMVSRERQVQVADAWVSEDCTAGATTVWTVDDVTNFYLANGPKNAEAAIREAIRAFAQATPDLITRDSEERSVALTAVVRAAPEITEMGLRIARTWSADPMCEEV